LLPKHLPVALALGIKAIMSGQSRIQAGSSARNGGR
jgi:hypothetical protein